MCGRTKGTKTHLCCSRWKNSSIWYIILNFNGVLILYNTGLINIQLSLSFPAFWHVLVYYGFIYVILGLFKLLLLNRLLFTFILFYFNPSVVINLIILHYDWINKIGFANVLSYNHFQFYLKIELRYYGIVIFVLLE